jgi:hypothetical protein
MTEEMQGKRGEAAWKEQRDAVAKRNAEAHKRGAAERRLKDRAVDARDRVRAAQEAEELQQLNARIAKRSAGGPG